MLSRYQFFSIWFIDSMQLQSIPASCFVDINKLILKLIWRSKRPRIASLVWKKNKFWVLTLPNFKTYYKATVIKTVWYQWKKRQKISRREWNPEVDPQLYGQLICVNVISLSVTNAPFLCIPLHVSSQRGCVGMGTRCIREFWVINSVVLLWT